MDNRQHIPPRRILLTGSAGNLGRPVASALLARGHAVRGFDRVADEQLDDHVVADLTDKQAVQDALADCDTVIHLAGHAYPAPLLDTLLAPNVIGMIHLVEAACDQGVPRFVFASTGQVSSRCTQRPVPVDARVPHNGYALTKLWGEDLGAMVARQGKLQFLAVRIGWTPSSAEDARQLAAIPDGPNIYLSHRDAGRFFIAAAEASLDDLPDDFAVVHAVGPSPDGLHKFDPEPAHRLLGFEGRDTFPEGLADRVAREYSPT